MWRSVLAPGLSLAVLFLFTGCSDDDTPDAGDAGPSDAGDGPCHPDNLQVDIASTEGLSYTNARFSPDGTEIALIAWRGLALDDLVIVDRCGENLRRLGIRASAKAVSTWGPSWSADGTQIYFVGSEDSVRRVSAAGGISEIVLPVAEAPVLDVSRDGTKVLYATREFRVFDLGTRTSTAYGVYGTSPRFSPDGTQVAFSRERKIEIMNLETREIREVLSFDSLVRLSVAWFSTGDRLAITSERGTEIVELTTPIARRTVAPEAIVRDVDVSRDDQAILFGLNGQPQVRVIRGFD